MSMLTSTKSFIVNGVVAMAAVCALAYLAPQEASADVDRLLRQSADAKEDIHRDKKDAKGDMKREKKDAKGDVKREKKDAKGDVKREKKDAKGDAKRDLKH